MDEPASAAAMVEPTAGGNPAETRFRIFRRGEWRRAFRLEQVFWTALEEAAAEKGAKVADYVRSIVESEPEGAANSSSLLRVHAATWLQARIARLEIAQQQREILHAALAAPLPCFVISATRALVSFNSEFSAYVTGRAQAASAEDVSKARLTLDIPVDRLVEVLAGQPGRVVLCGFNIRSSAAIASGRARVTLAQPSRRDLVVGYILPG
jgi:predicted DNA-binding ribbon-helix-helix protein